MAEIETPKAKPHRGMSPLSWIAALCLVTATGAVVWKTVGSSSTSQAAVSLDGIVQQALNREAKKTELAKQRADLGKELEAIEVAEAKTPPALKSLVDVAKQLQAEQIAAQKAAEAPAMTTLDAASQPAEHTGAVTASTADGMPATLDGTPPPATLTVKCGFDAQSGPDCSGEALMGVAAINTKWGDPSSDGSRPVTVSFVKSGVTYIGTLSLPKKGGPIAATATTFTAKPKEG